MRNPFANRYLTPWNVVLLVKSSQATVFGALSREQNVRVSYNILVLKQLSFHNVMPKVTNILGELSCYICIFDANL